MANNKTYNHNEWLTLEELEQFSKEHPEVWGDSTYLFHPDNAIVVPDSCGCDLCHYCEGMETYNCQNLLYHIVY